MNFLKVHEQHFAFQHVRYKDLSFLIKIRRKSFKDHVAPVRKKKETALLPYPVSSSPRRHQSILFKFSFPSRSRKLNFTSINCRRKSFAFLIDWCGNYRFALRHSCSLTSVTSQFNCRHSGSRKECWLFFWNTIFPRQINKYSDLQR